MENVTVNKIELLEKIKQNRTDHRQIFEEALTGFQAKVEAELKALVKRARDGLKDSVRLNFLAPEDHTRDYDRVIAMIEMSVGVEIELSEYDFSKYVMDEWEWQGKFLSNTYGSRTATGKFGESYAVS